MISGAVMPPSVMPLHIATPSRPMSWPRRSCGTMAAIQVKPAWNVSASPMPCSTRTASTSSNDEATAYSAPASAQVSAPASMISL